MAIIIFFIVHWYTSLFFQTFFHHRYSAHQMFTMSKFWEKVFFIGTFIFQGSSYLSPYAYGILHRIHHAYTDKELDPHSPIRDHNLFNMMWKTKVYYSGINMGKIQVDPKFMGNLPSWKSFDLFADNRYVRFAWGALYVLFYINFATEWWHWLFLPIQFIMSPVHGAIINWFAHMYGYINFKQDNTSKNFLPVDVLMMGESYHNNHHMRAKNPNFGYRWFEIDPTYPLIKLLAFLKVIKLNPVID